VIATTDDGAHGGSESYLNPLETVPFAWAWTFGTSDDWGAVAAFFKEVPPNNLENYHRPKSQSNDIICVGGIG
jgi:hypothetical protein